MQRGSYFLDAPMSRERNMEANGSTCPPCRRDTGFENEHYNNSFIQPHDIYYGKELIKQTMLQQEAILKNQVAELHRLYETQTVIMDELRSRELLGGDRAKVNSSVQNPLCSERPLDNNSQDMINSPRMLFSSSPITIDYKGKKKMLDLSLPDSEYMNCEERELYEQDEALKFPENQDPKVVLPFNHCCEVEGFSDVLTAPEPSSSRLPAVFDLNEPYQASQVDIPIANFQGFFGNSHTRPDLDDSSQKMAEENQEKLPTGNYESGGCSLIREPGSNMNLFGPDMLTMSLGSPHHDANVAHERPVFCCLNQSKVSLDEKSPRSLEAPDRKQRLLKEKSMKKTKPPKIPKSREIFPNQPNPESSAVTTRKYVNNVEWRPIVIQALPCFSKQSLYKKRKCKSLGNSLAPGNLEGPISPKNEESSRPRGDSTEKETESGANEHLSKQEAEVRQAAEAIVSISSTIVQACQNNGIPDSSSNCNADYLRAVTSVPKNQKSPARRKRRRKSSANIVVNLVDELKLLDRMHEMGCLKEGLPGWGKVHKRRRRPRFAATNPSPIIVIVTKV